MSRFLRNFADKRVSVCPFSFRSLPSCTSPGASKVHSEAMEAWEKHGAKGGFFAGGTCEVQLRGRGIPKSTWELGKDLFALHKGLIAIHPLLPSRMLRDFAERLQQQAAARFCAVPGRGTAWVGQRHEIECDPGALAAKAFADHLHQRADWQELGDGQFAHRDHQFRFEEAQFGIQPTAAFGDLGRGGNAVATVGIFAGETAAYGGHVNCIAERRFIDSALLGKPAEHRLAGGPSERAAQDRLFDAGSLAHQENFAHYGGAGDHRLVHGGAAVAAQERGDMGLEIGGGFQKVGFADYGDFQESLRR